MTEQECNALHREIWKRYPRCWPHTMLLTGPQRQRSWVVMLYLQGRLSTFRSPEEWKEWEASHREELHTLHHPPVRWDLLYSQLAFWAGIVWFLVFAGWVSR